MANVSLAVSTDFAMDVDKSTETLPLAATSLQENSTKPDIRPSTPSLPPEIMFLILSRAIPPFALLDTTLSPGENSAWCQTLRLMQSIVLVCRSWHDAGIVFLYENVCIRRCHQLESLQRTLTSSLTKNFSLLVKSLTIQCYIPKDKTFDFRVNLEAVVVCCTSMSTFTYNAGFVPPLHSTTIRFPAHITHFRLEGDFDYGELFVILMQLKETLVSFHIMMWCDDIEESVDPWSRLCLPSLQALSVAGSRVGGLNILQSHLTMPSLQKLTFVGYDFPPGSTSDTQNAIIHFLELHGSQLRQLHFGFQSTPEAFKQVLTFCPLLERIILHPSALLPVRTSYDLLHPKLRWVDFICDIDDNPSSGLCLSKTNLPALERIRHFCNFPFMLRKWPDECPPTIEVETEGFVIDVSQHKLTCLGNGLFVWENSEEIIWKGGNSDSDSDYQSTSASFSSDYLENECTSEDED